MLKRVVEPRGCRRSEPDAAVSGTGGRSGADPSPWAAPGAGAGLEPGRRLAAVSEIPSRGALLVGSVPVADAEEAMAEALTRLGSRLHSLPDGETGKRRNWIIHIIESFRNHPDLEVAKEGDWSDYDRTPRFRVRRGRRLSGERVDLGYLRAFRAAYPAFQAARLKAGLPGLAYQVGIPGDLDLALFTFGPAGILTRRRPFTEATVRDIAAIRAEAGDDVVFQIEVPAELVFVARMPAAARRLVARYMAGGIARLARMAPLGSRFGIHLCLGDMNHRALASLKDVGPVVLLANAIARRWPDTQRLEYIHAPFAAADIPPTLDSAWYVPLSRLRLPRPVRFVAGCIHEDLGLDDQRRLVALIEERLDRRVDLATACGLGRRDRAAAMAAIDQTAAVS